MSDDSADRKRSTRDEVQTGDKVSFEVHGATLNGTVARRNPKTAHVLTETGSEYRVPYALLKLDHRTTTRATEQLRSTTELDAIASSARKLLNQHGLSDWRFRYDRARMRAGSCRFHERFITMSREFARRAPATEITDTLLHEIAHALVGPGTGHGPAWQRKAVEIGCSARRCHDISFAPPLYIVQCESRCFSATANRRRRNVVCRHCGRAIAYQTYTEGRWTKLQQSTRD